MLSPLAVVESSSARALPFEAAWPAEPGASGELPLPWGADGQRKSHSLAR